MPETPPDNPPKLEIDWLKALAGALAAVTAAVLLSTLGAAGTLIGAAVGSVAATIGSAVYAQGLAHSKHTVRRLTPEAVRRDEPLPWRRIGLASAGAFAVAVVAITGFEAVSGHSVSSYTGGTQDQASTLGGVTGHSSRSGPKPAHFQPADHRPHQAHTPTDSPDPTDTPTDTATDTPTPAPTDVPTPSDPATPSDSPSLTTTPTP
jgi:hypothetical protein